MKIRKSDNEERARQNIQELFKVAMDLREDALKQQRREKRVKVHKVSATAAAIHRAKTGVGTQS